MSDFTAVSSETNDSATLTGLAANTMATTSNTMVNAMGIPILNLDQDGTDGNIRDLILTLGHTQGIGDISTAIESSFATAATCIDGLFSHRCTSGISVFSGGNDDDSHTDNEDDEESTPSTSGNYLDEWTPQYSSSLSIFATLSSGNFLSENEITQIFSREVSISHNAKIG
ncbi:unnamed protein product [Onchocerca ochengi]|uniref:Uncharacterized protein n=1 Tax=Onchocerca ochengi TaxID=42157 RepID=A0A182E9H2_ONCOC|nr:unnamed protein product [Onchocerca ochengi]